MSRDTKRQIIWFQADDGEAVARHLEKMAANGWLLDGVDNWNYHFRRSEPVKVKYAVTYFPEASIFDPGLMEEQETYAGYCAAAGWELAGAYGPVQYFRTDRENPTPIETDEAIRLDAVRRTMRKTFVLSYAILLLIPAVWTPLGLDMLHHDPIGLFSSPANLATLAMMAGIALFSGGMLLDHLLWILRSKRSIARGGGCVKPHTRARLWANGAMLALCAVVLTVYLLQRGSRQAVFVMTTVTYLGTMLLARWIMKILKRRCASRGSVIAGYLCFGIAAAVLVGIGSAILLPRLVKPFSAREEAERYTYSEPDGGRITWPVYHDALPIALEDLGFTVTADDHCSYEADEQRTPLAFKGDYKQQVLNPDSPLDDLRYQVFRTSWPWLLERGWEKLTGDKDDAVFPMEEIDPALWGALEAYQKADMEKYYFRWPDMAVYVSFPREIEQARRVQFVNALRTDTSA